MSIQRVFIALFLAALALPAQAGIFANINVTGAQFNSSDNRSAPHPALPFSGTLSSDLVVLPFKNSCRTVTSMPGQRFSWCYFNSDHSGIDSPYMAEYLSRFTTPVSLVKQFAVDLGVYEDGSYYGMFTFIEGAFEVTQEDVGMIQRSLNVNYQFEIKGSGLDPATSIDAELALRLWSQANFSKLLYAVSWDVINLDQENAPVEWEGWTANFEATTGAVPEPAAPLLFATGLLALLGLRAGRRRAGGKVPADSA